MEKCLYTIDCCSDIFVDSFLCDEDMNLIFISVWARDTSMLEFLARIELRDHQNGISKINFNERLPENVGNGVNIPSSRIQKFGKASCRNKDSSIFGELVHTFVYDERVNKFDYGNRSLLCIGDKLENINVWPLVRANCHIPLLDKWESIILERFYDNDLITPLTNGVGVNGISINLDEGIVETIVSDLLTRNILTI